MALPSPRRDSTSKPSQPASIAAWISLRRCSWVISSRVCRLGQRCLICSSKEMPDPCSRVSLRNTIEGWYRSTSCRPLASQVAAPTRCSWPISPPTNEQSRARLPRQATRRASRSRLLIRLVLRRICSSLGVKSIGAEGCIGALHWRHPGQPRSICQGQYAYPHSPGVPGLTRISGRCAAKVMAFFESEIGQ